MKEGEKKEGIGRNRRRKKKERKKEEEIIVKIFLSSTPSPLPLPLPSLSLYLAPNLSLCLPCVYTVASIYKPGRKVSSETVFEPPASRTKKNKSLTVRPPSSWLFYHSILMRQRYCTRLQSPKVSDLIISSLQSCHVNLSLFFKTAAASVSTLGPWASCSLLQILCYPVLLAPSQCHGLSTPCCLLHTFFYVKLAIA